jgi:hypothetical protein
MGTKKIMSFVSVVAGVCLLTSNGLAQEFQDRVRLNTAVNTGSVEMSPDISRDGTELYFIECVRGLPPTCRAKLSRRDDPSQPWQRAGYVDDEWNYMTAGVSVSPDGLEMYFGDELWPESFRSYPPESNGGDLWVSRRATIEDGWEAPSNLGDLVNSDAIDTFPSLSRDGLTLLFQSERPDGYGSMDIWAARRNSTAEPFGPAENLGSAINGRSGDGAAELSPDGLTLFFTSNRSGGHGNFDLWMSTRTSPTAPWGEPLNLGPSVNSPDLEAFPSLSADGQTLYYHSGFGNPSKGDGDIFQVTIQQPVPEPELQAGDADQDRDFDQFDLIRVQQSAKYLTGNAATWGQGDWNGAPGGKPGSPPAGNGLFDQLDIIAALSAGKYLSGPYAALAGPGAAGDGQTSIVYHAGTGELSVDAPAGTQLTSINIDSAAGIFTGQAATNLGGSFDNDSDNNIFKATFGSSFGSLSFGNVAQAGLSQQLVLSDLSVVGSLAGGGDLGAVDLVYVPEPATALLAITGLLGVVSLCLIRKTSAP